MKINSFGTHLFLLYATHMTASDEQLKEEHRKAELVTRCMASADNIIVEGAKDEEEILCLNLVLANALIQKAMYYIARPDVLRSVKR